MVGHLIPINHNPCLHKVRKRPAGSLSCYLTWLLFARSITADKEIHFIQWMLLLLCVKWGQSREEVAGMRNLFARGLCGTQRLQIVHHQVNRACTRDCCVRSCCAWWPSQWHFLLLSPFVLYSVSVPRNNPKQYVMCCCCPPPLVVFALSRRTTEE